MLRIVPWSCREEWLETYQNLYNFDNVEQQMKGLQRVEAWKSRSGSKLSLAVEATASLIAAGVEDVRSLVSPYVVRHTMAMVIVRFVNGMVDMEQKGAYARSVQSIADEIGLPDWLVDLRHEATHASLPSLEVLRAGCRFALDWLRDGYWKSQIAEFHERNETLVTLLGKYAKLCENVKRGKKTAKNANNGKLAQEIADLVGEYDMWQSLLDLSFGEQGLLHPSIETLQGIFPESARIKTTKILLELPKDVRQWLSPLLKALHKTNDQFLSNFVSFLVRRVHELVQNFRNKLLAHFHSCLAYFILFNCSKKNIEKKQWKIKAELDYLALLEVCLQNPSANNQRFLPLIIDNLETSESLKDKLYKFSAIKIALNKDKSLTKSTDNEKTDLETLKQHFPLVAKKVEASLTESDEDNSVWKQCPPSFAHNYKFGAFIGKEPRQNRNLNQTNDESMELETNLEQCEQEIVEGDGSENEFENDLNEIPEILCASETSDASVEKDLTEEMIKDISKNICIF